MNPTYYENLVAEIVGSIRTPTNELNSLVIGSGWQHVHVGVQSTARVGRSAEAEIVKKVVIVEKRLLCPIL